MYEAFCDFCGTKILVENPDEDCRYLCHDCLADWEVMQEQDYRDDERVA